MKKLFRTIAGLAMALTISFASFATTPKVKETKNPVTFEVGMYNVTNTHNLKLFVEKAKGQYLKIELKSIDGKSLLTEFVDKKNTKYGVNLNMDNLAEGNYVIEISNDQELLKKEIQVVTNQPKDAAVRQIKI